MEYFNVGMDQSALESQKVTHNKKVFRVIGQIVIGISEIGKNVDFRNIS